MIIPDFKINRFFGINTNIKDTKMFKAGLSPDSLNWLAEGKEGDHIELRRGYALLGQTRETSANGKITGLGVGVKYDGTEVPYFTHSRKVKYYDKSIDDIKEIGTDILPAEADGKDMWFEKYQGISGSFLYLGSSKSTVFKLPIANPDNYVDQNITEADGRFDVFNIGVERTYAGVKNTEKTGLFLSYINNANLSDYPKTSAESIGTGDGTTKTFTHTLANIGAPKTAMVVTVTDSTETFNDNRDGILIGDKGGTGTINYATGELSVTFNTAPANSQAITTTYYTEDATTHGLLDFSGTAATEGAYWPQANGGGNLMSIINFNLVDYCFHKLKTYQFSQSLDDTTNLNKPYRDIGIPYTRAAFPSPKGILFIDNSNASEPKFRLLQILQGTNNTSIEPKSISDNLDLTAYDFDYGLAFNWGNYRIFAMQEKVNGVANEFNTIMLIQNTLSGAWNKLDFYASVLAEYNGTLIAGDPITNNVYTLFSGYDDDGDIIKNYFKLSDLELGTNNFKTCRRMVIDGLIQKEQSFDISISLDGGAYSVVRTIYGSGDYVGSGINTYIGASTIGSKVVGGGGGETAHPFELDFPINTEKFSTISIKIEAKGIGYVSINSLTFKDIRDKGRKVSNARTK